MSLRIPLDWEPYRKAIPGYPSGDRHNGAFAFPAIGTSVIVSNGGGWEHVSVSREDRCPIWEEMDGMKRSLWEPQDAVIQLHVPVDEHINVHPYCLHLWRPIDQAIPLPPAWMVG